MKIYVGNISFNATDGDVRRLFENHGTVSECVLISDRLKNRPKGFGFVVMPDRVQAEDAIEALDGEQFMGRALEVKKANSEGPYPSGKKRARAA